MIVVDPAARITVDEIVSHSWVGSVTKGGPINGLVNEVGVGVRIEGFQELQLDLQQHSLVITPPIRTVFVNFGRSGLFTFFT